MKLYTFELTYSVTPTGLTERSKLLSIASKLSLMTIIKILVDRFTATTIKMKLIAIGSIEDDLLEEELAKIQVELL